MFENIKNWFLKPYPAITSVKQKILLSLVLGKIVFLFLYIFRPFDIGQLDNNPLHYTLGFGLITFLITIFSVFLSPILFPKFHNPNIWTIGKASFFFLVILLFISIANWYYNLQVARPKGVLESSLLYYVFLTILVGFFPLLFYVFINERKANKQRNSVAQKLSNTKKETQIISTEDNIADTTITLVADNKKDNFTFDLKDLMYISSEGNYASIFYIQNDSIKEELLRNSLNNVEYQLVAYKSVVRCHKSFLVNAQQVLKMQGNARGYFLQLPNLNFLIPVSRTFPKEFLYTLIK